MPKDTWSNLPNGVTVEMLDEYARQRENARRRADYAKHPERVERQRMSTYRNFFNRRGYLVVPMPPAGPWDELTKGCLMHALESAMVEQGGGAVAENA